MSPFRYACNLATAQEWAVFLEQQMKAEMKKEAWQAAQVPARASAVAAI
jgi:hypothetical protein